MHPPAPKRPRPLVRLWLVSLLLFVGGFAGKLVMEAQPGATDGYIVTMLWQMGWYAAGLVMWLWWCNTQPQESKAGCWIGVVLVVGAVFAVMSSSPH